AAKPTTRTNIGFLYKQRSCDTSGGTRFMVNVAPLALRSADVQVVSISAIEESRFRLVSNSLPLGENQRGQNQDPCPRCLNVHSRHKRQTSSRFGGCTIDIPRGSDRHQILCSAGNVGTGRTPAFGILTPARARARAAP